MNHKQAISLEEARVIMRSLVLAKGEDYVYEKNQGSCLYFAEGKPSCLIGHVLAVLGVTDVTEGGSAASIIGHHFPATPDYVVLAFHEAQQAQDTGSTWGEALDVFEQQVEHAESAA